MLSWFWFSRFVSFFVLQLLNRLLFLFFPLPISALVRLLFVLWPLVFCTKRQSELFWQELEQSLVGFLLLFSFFVFYIEVTLRNLSSLTLISFWLETRNYLSSQLWLAKIDSLTSNKLWQKKWRSKLKARLSKSEKVKTKTIVQIEPNTFSSFHSNENAKLKQIKNQFVNVCMFGKTLWSEDVT